jgi:hypothetical protein
LEAVIVESEEMAIPRQHLGKHVSAATNKHTAVEEILKASFSVHSLLKLYDED